MPIGYNATAQTGDVQLTFPSVADKRRTLGASYLFGGRRTLPDIDMGADIYGWTRDARHMANAKVHTTALSQRQYDRTPRFHIKATGSVQTPCFSAKDESNHALERMLRGQVQAPVRDQLRGAGSIGNLSTPAGQRYARKILDRRAAELTALNAQQDTTAPSSDRELTEVEGTKTALDLEFGDILDEIDAGVVERGTARGIAEWSVKFLKTLPYYDNVDTGKLINFNQQLDQIADRTIEVLAERTQRTAGTDWVNGSEQTDKFKSLSQLIALWSKRTANIIVEYMRFINLQLPQRILVVRDLLNRAGLKAVGKSIVDATPVQIEDEAQRDDIADPFAFAPFGGDDDEGPPVPDVGDGAGGEEEEAPVAGNAGAIAGLPRSAAEISSAVRDAVQTGVSAQNALQGIVDRWNAVLRPTYNPRATSTFRNVKATLVQRIKNYLAANPVGAGRHHRLRRRR